MTRTTKSATLLAIMSVSAAGCMRAPEVALTGVRVGGIGFTGATLIAELQIDNPNRLGIEMDSITFQLDAQDASAGSTWTQVTGGTNTQRFRVARQGTAVVQIPIEFAYARLSTPLRSIMESGRFNYRVSGQVFVRRPLPRRVPFSDEGSLPLFGERR
jgi:LEA14-like dessication related protein